MVTSAAPSVEAYLEEIEPPRREPFERLLGIIRERLDPRFEEGMDGMVHWSIPHSIHPAGYHCDPEQPVPFLALAKQKRHLSLYDMGLMAMPEQSAWFEREFAERHPGWRLDRGKSCLRFASMSRIPFELIGELVARISLDDYLEAYLRYADRATRGA
ncbi:hypothetical protein USB125703_00715 [Pseudoclavibacter triregionum]|nr:hypothetical protein USB125703_00715 [Pseudoclavibacter triregionum]